MNLHICSLLLLIHLLPKLCFPLTFPDVHPSHFLVTFLFCHFIDDSMAQLALLYFLLDILLFIFFIFFCINYIILSFHHSLHLPIPSLNHYPTCTSCHSRPEIHSLFIYTANLFPFPIYPRSAVPPSTSLFPYVPSLILSLTTLYSLFFFLALLR